MKKFIDYKKVLDNTPQTFFAIANMFNDLAEAIEKQGEEIKNCNDNNELNTGHLLALQDRIKKLE